VALSARRSRRPALGQHFLRDGRALAGLAAALPLGPSRTVLEIGPGEGALTQHLLASGAQVIAVEVDPRLTERLRSRFGEALELVEADVLTVDFAELLRGRRDERALLAGNLPYYISSPILRKILATHEVVEAAVLLLQKEFAQRVVASPGGRDYAYLSVLTRLYAEPEELFTVRRGAFQPPPQVDSAALRLKLRSEATPDPHFIRFLEAAFRQPRKTLRNNLRSLFPLEALDADPEAGRRAQQLELDALRAFWLRLRAATSST